MAVVFLGIRSGSKGIPHKNVRLLCGKPLFMWTLEAALKAPRVQKIVVSSDSQQYLSMLPSNTSIIPITRPKALSSDSSTDEDYILHAANHPTVTPHLTTDTVVIRACATSPFQTEDDYELIVEQLARGSLVTSMAVTESGCFIEKGLRLDRLGNLYPLESLSNRYEYFVPGRQSCAHIYRRSNLIGTTYQVLRSSLGLVHFPSGAVGIPAERGIDIDTEHDWLIAELLMNHYIKVGCSLSTFKPIILG
jgi:CMP-N,N'-diacetyllegionaminic acid synthase